MYSNLLLMCCFKTKFIYHLQHLNILKYCKASQNSVHRSTLSIYYKEILTLLLNKHITQLIQIWNSI